MKEKLSIMLRRIADKLENNPESQNYQSQLNNDLIGQNNHVEKPDGEAQMIVFYSEDEEKKQNEIENFGIKGLINKVNRLLNG